MFPFLLFPAGLADFSFPVYHVQPGKESHAPLAAGTLLCYTMDVKSTQIEGK
jgi:hypothetical protein